MDYLSLIRPKTGYMVSISTIPRGDDFADLGSLKITFLARKLLNLADNVNKWRASRWDVKYKYLVMQPSGKDLEQLREYVESGKLRPVIGNTVHYQDVEAVRKGCDVVYRGKGGIGKTVISFE